MEKAENTVRTRSFHVRLSASTFQIAAATALGLAAWGCMVAFVVNERARDAGHAFPAGVAGFALYLLEIGYLIFLRTQTMTLELDDTKVRLTPTTLPRAVAQVGLLPWYRAGATGTIIEIRAGDRKLRLATRRTLREGQNRPPGAFRADALLVDADVDGLLTALGGQDRIAALESLTPRAKMPRTSALRGMAPWLSTIAMLAVFGVTLGFAFPDAMQTLSGVIAVETFMFCAIAVGLVSTVTGWRARSGQPEPSPESKKQPLARLLNGGSPTERPSFVRAASGMVTWLAASVVIGALVISPFVLVIQSFSHWVDEPGCTAECEARGLSFLDYRNHKSGSTCSCGASGGGEAVTFRARYTISGGDSFGAKLADAVIRLVALLGIGFGANAGMFAGAFWIHTWWKKRAKK